MSLIQSFIHSYIQQVFEKPPMDFKRKCTQTPKANYSVSAVSTRKASPNQCSPEVAIIKGADLEKGCPSFISRDSISPF